MKLFYSFAFTVTLSLVGALADSLDKHSALVEEKEAAGITNGDIVQRKLQQLRGRSSPTDYFQQERDREAEYEDGFVWGDSFDDEDGYGGDSFDHAGVITAFHRTQKYNF